MEPRKPNDESYMRGWFKVGVEGNEREAKLLTDKFFGKTVAFCVKNKDTSNPQQHSQDIEMKKAEPKMADLVSEYNELVPDSPVKKFSSIEVGKERLKKARAQAGAARSWKDDAVRAARKVRHAVIVGKHEYRSVKQAFEALGLPLAKHVSFRKRLKAAGKLTEFGHTWKTKEI